MTARKLINVTAPAGRSGFTPRPGTPGHSISYSLRLKNPRRKGLSTALVEAARSI